MAVPPSRAVTAASTPYWPITRRLLRDQSLNRSFFEGLDLVRAGVEANDLNLRLLAGLAYTCGRAFRGEQVGGEYTNDVGILLQRRAHDLCRCGRIIV